MDEKGLSPFGESGKPDIEWCWKHYEQGVEYNTKINLQETVKVNENFFVGKQWEGVQANGLPTPQYNFLKRTVGHTTASIMSENTRLMATPLEAYAGSKELIDPVQIVNAEFVRIMTQVRFPRLQKVFMRDSAVRGEGCMYSWWDADAKAGKGIKGRIRTEILKNTNVFFGNQSDGNVQTQPWIQIEAREMLWDVRRRAKKNGLQDWEEITTDDAADFSAIDEQKHISDRVTVIKTMWKDLDNGDVWAMETTKNYMIREPYNTKMRLYPLIWLPWDYVDNSYHGQAMITGLIPNQIFVNKIWAMSSLNLYRSAFGKYVYDKTKIAHIDNRVGAAIPVQGNVEGAIKSIDPPAIHPQVFQYIESAINTTQETLGATEASLGEGKAYNTSAILSLQKASSTPHAITQQNMYSQVEDLGSIWLEMMVQNYGTRLVDMPVTDEMRAMLEQANQLAEAAGQPTQDIPETVPVEFDFGTLEDHEMSIEIDAGGSSYYSETASLQTLDNMLINGFITPVQYLEHIPDGNVSGRRKLIEELKEEARKQEELQMAQMQQQMAMQEQQAATGEIAETPARAEERTTGFKELGEALRSIERR